MPKLTAEQLAARKQRIMQSKKRWRLLQRLQDVVVQLIDQQVEVLVYYGGQHRTLLLHNARMSRLATELEQCTGNDAGSASESDDD